MAAYLMENPVRTFESCMGDVGLGKPLFFPDIPPRTGYITLGDVGYIRSGSFWRSFNLLHTKDTMINNLGVPEGHEPFNLQGKDIQKSSIPPKMWVKSLREVDEDLSTYNRFYIFALRHWSVIGIGKGVFMHMPEESTHVKVTDAVVEEWKSLYHKNAKTWHKWTQTTLKITLDPQHLIVVTGYVQTPKWVIATAEGTGQFTMTYQTLRGASAEILEQSGHMEVMIRSGYGPPAMIDEYEGEGTILADGFAAVPPSISNHYPFVEGIDPFSSAINYRLYRLVFLVMYFCESRSGPLGHAAILVAKQRRRRGSARRKARMRFCAKESKAWNQVFIPLCLCKVQMDLCLRARVLEEHTSSASKLVPHAK